MTNPVNIQTCFDTEKEKADKAAIKADKRHKRAEKQQQNADAQVIS